MALQLRHAVFARVVYPRLTEAIGGRVAWAISGGAPLNPDLAGGCAPATSGGSTATGSCSSPAGRKT
jgi:hypothetical protein